MGKYEVLCRLSTGGMSEIYLAHQRGAGGFRKLVVLKTILPDIGGEEDFVRMFLDEARMTAAFAHPNIAQVFDFDVDDGQLFMAMEFVQGCTLVEMARACRQAKEPIPIGFTLSAVRDTALALHYAHTFTDVRGRKQVVIHRDVAEKNIMVTHEGVTKLLDFGIAKAQGKSNRTTVGMVKGTSGYMSPEQIRGEPLDGRSDIFALGIVLHECLTGMRLFHGKSPEEGMLAALNQAITQPSKLNPRIRPELDQVVLKALARNREERFATALEFARAIDRVGRDEMWHPEQSGELVSRFFAERRAETSRVLEATSMGDSTGELRLESLMIKPKASMPSGPDAKRGDAAPPPPPGPKPSGARAPVPPAPPSAPEPITSPARQRVGNAPTPPIPPPKADAPPPPASRPPPKAHYDDDDEDDAKTIPASSLPDELKALRNKYKSMRDGAIGAGVVPARPKPGDERVTAPGPNTIVVDESITGDVPLKPGAPKRVSLATQPAAESVGRGEGGATEAVDLKAKNEFDDDARTVMADKDAVTKNIPEDLKRTFVEPLSEGSDPQSQVTDPRRTVSNPQASTADESSESTAGNLARVNTGEHAAHETQADLDEEGDEEEGGSSVVLVVLVVFALVVLLGTGALFVLKLGPFAQ